MSGEGVLEPSLPMSDGDETRMMLFAWALISGDFLFVEVEDKAGEDGVEDELYDRGEFFNGGSLNCASPAVRSGYNFPSSAPPMLDNDVSSVSAEPSDVDDEDEREGPKELRDEEVILAGMPR